MLYHRSSTKTEGEQKKYIELWGYHLKFLRLVKQLVKFQDIVKGAGPRLANLASFWFEI